MYSVCLQVGRIFLARLGKMILLLTLAASDLLTFFIQAVEELLVCRSRKSEQQVMAMALP